MKADVSQRDQVVALLAEIERSMPPLRGVIHAAGLLDDGLLQDLDRARFHTVMAPKIDGSWNLHQLTMDLPLDFFVLFSSVAAVLGTPGQANYAAANAFMDALAHTRRAQGRHALSINWGPWSEVGLAAAQSNRGERLAGVGLKSLPPAYGLQALERLLQLDSAGVAVMSFDPGLWRQSQPPGAASSLLMDFGGPSASAARPPAIDLRATLRAAESGRQRRAILERHIREQISQVVRTSPSRIGAQTAFGTLGLDSLMALECRNRLEASTGVALSATVVWNYPTLATLVPYLADEMQLSLEEEAPRGEDAPRPPVRAATADSWSQLADLSEAEAELLLAGELAAMGNLDERPPEEH